MIKLFQCNIQACSVLLQCYLLIIYCSPLNAAEQQPLTDQIKWLDDEFITLSSIIYQQPIESSNSPLDVIADIDRLLTEIKQMSDGGRSIAAIQLLSLNINTLQDNLDHQAVIAITELLLDNNVWNQAHSLLQRLKQESDSNILATVQFLFAKYHAERHEWSQVNERLRGIFSELSADNAAYAYLLKGVALQKLKKHRQSTEFYSNIPASSRYYVYAQLNTAIANIRQGWLTNAQSSINDLIHDLPRNISDELTNRLYLVLGYALLQKEYYRDARESFRNIGLSSRYANRALLGIALTATSQGDFVGGINALSILKDKDTTDLSVDESYLVIPYVYERLQQEMTVINSYNEAMDYYQQRIQQLDKISHQQWKFSSVQFNSQTSSLIIRNNSLDYGAFYPKSFINNYHLLLDFSYSIKASKLQQRIKALLTNYDDVFQHIIDQLISQRKKHLNSYLNQSRYGLARLYDSSNRTEH